jgi:Ni2+-binding GTPase involved in maturation of urease and hydrogenase
MNTRLLLIGGFLGAGKTTLIAATAARLTAAGHRVGIITNDQAPDLVDTGLLRQEGRPVREVAGSCFCCDFTGFKTAARELHHGARADVVLAEPVGSCTDLSATILQPLKDRYRDEFRCAPLTVLVDPERLRQVLADAPGLHPDAAYIAFKQLEEADHIAISKGDRLAADARAALRTLVERSLPGRPVHLLSARSGEGVQAWLDTLLADGATGRRVVAVDYDRYAAGEALLGWLNAEYAVGAWPDGDGAGFARRLLECMRDRCRAAGAAIGHIKLLLQAHETIAANLTDPDGVIEVRTLASTGESRLVINARVAVAPAILERWVDEALADAGAASWPRRRQRSLSPGRPQPTHRYPQVVAG